MMVKKYSTDEFQRCCELYVQVFNGPPWFDNWTAALACAHIQELVENKNFIGFTAWDTDMVGAVFAYTRTFYKGTEIYIEDLFVASNCQRRGFGMELMREIENYATSISALSITLITGADKPSFDFFKTFGCKHIDSLAFMHKRIK